MTIIHTNFLISLILFFIYFLLSLDYYLPTYNFLLSCTGTKQMKFMYTLKTLMAKTNTASLLPSMEQLVDVLISANFSFTS